VLATNCTQRLGSARARARAAAFEAMNPVRLLCQLSWVPASMASSGVLGLFLPPSVHGRAASVVLNGLTPKLPTGSPDDRRTPHTIDKRENGSRAATYGWRYLRAAAAMNLKR